MFVWVVVVCLDGGGGCGICLYGSGGHCVCWGSSGDFCQYAGRGVVCWGSVGSGAVSNIASSDLSHEMNWHLQTS